MLLFVAEHSHISSYTLLIYLEIPLEVITLNWKPGTLRSPGPLCRSQGYHLENYCFSQSRKRAQFSLSQFLPSTTTFSSQVNSIFKSIQSFSTVCMCTGVKPSDGAWVTPEELHPEENLSSPPQHLSVPNSSSARVKP